MRFRKDKKLMITAIVLSVLFILGDAGVLFLSQEKFGHIPQGQTVTALRWSKVRERGRDRHHDGRQERVCRMEGFPVR